MKAKSERVIYENDWLPNSYGSRNGIEFRALTIHENPCPFKRQRHEAGHV